MRFNVDEYYRMAEAGILKRYEPVELIRGEVWTMSPIGVPHAGILKQLIAHFSKLGTEVVLSVQDPLRLDDQSEPEPDLVLLRPPVKQYQARHPAPDDAFLVIEIADTSWDYDWNVKRVLYAEHAVRELWVIDAVAKAIHICREPQGREYRVESVARDQNQVAPLAFPQLIATVRELIG